MAPADATRPAGGPRPPSSAIIGAERHAVPPRDRSSALALLVALACVLLRSAVPVLWEQAHFDSDQAVVGLMAKHLAEGRALPFTIYGQDYMLAVESWLAAPAFLLLPPSVPLLKLPLVAVNVAVALLLFRVLTRDLRLGAWPAVAASLFFLLPPPIPASRLVEAAGGNIEPFAYVLLIWLCRARPVRWGLVAGFGIAHREFTAYGVVALTALELWHGRTASSRTLRRLATGAAVTAVTMLAVQHASAYGDRFGPGSASSLDLVAGGPWWSRMCWNTAEFGENVDWLFAVNLGTLFGWRVQDLGGYVTSTLVSGSVWMAWPIVVLSAAWLATRARAPRPDGPTRNITVPASAFTAYLILTGLVTLGAYLMISCVVRDGMLIRYTLLAMLVPTGLATALLQPARARAARTIAAIAAVTWAGLSAVEHGRLLSEYLREPPPGDHRALVELLDARGARYARAPYWTAYHLDFLSNERIAVASTDVVRIELYQDVVDQHPDETTHIAVEEVCRDPLATRFRRWCVR